MNLRTMSDACSFKWMPWEHAGPPYISVWFMRYMYYPRTLKGGVVIQSPSSLIIHAAFDACFCHQQKENYMHTMQGVQYMILLKLESMSVLIDLMANRHTC